MVRWQQKFSVAAGRPPLAFLRAATRGRPPVSGGRGAALARQRLSGAPKFRRATATDLLLRRRKRQPMRRQMPAPATGGLPSFSKWIMVNRPSKRVLAMKRVAASNYYITNHSVQLVNEEGFQNATVYGFNNIDVLRYMAGGFGFASCREID